MRPPAPRERPSSNTTFSSPPTPNLESSSVVPVVRSVRIRYKSRSIVLFSRAVVSQWCRVVWLRTRAVDVEDARTFDTAWLLFLLPPPSFDMSISAASREKFLTVWPTIREELLAYMQHEGMPTEANEWFRKVSSPARFHPSRAVHHADLLLAVSRSQHAWRYEAPGVCSAERTTGLTSPRRRQAQPWYLCRGHGRDLEGCTAVGGRVHARGYLGMVH